MIRKTCLKLKKRIKKRKYPPATGAEVLPQHPVGIRRPIKHHWLNIHPLEGMGKKGTQGQERLCVPVTPKEVSQVTLMPLTKES